ncbi:Flp pilus assembly complex ATPase component TadA [Candidatus Saccharibacteria bacterium]|nr:Flp pilus assembly complex ATPase component TadA [Candidatus Saccharibacteria bacterium]
MSGGQKTKSNNLESNDAETLFQQLIDLVRTQNLRDIHLDPRDGHYLIRTKSSTARLATHAEISKVQATDLIDLLFIKSHLHPSSRPIPQDARLSHANFLIQLTTLPTILGPKIFLHFTDQTKLTRDLSKLGFTPDQLPIAESITKLPSGLILVLGAGKTTTMFSLLSLFDASKLSISTVETRHTYRLPGVNQFIDTTGQISRQEQAFAAAMRQHSDVILLSQIDSTRLAELSLDAASNRRIIITSLPITDPYSAADFLTHLGTTPFLTLHNLRLVISQQLVPTTDSTSSFTGRFDLLEINDHYRQLFLAGLTPTEIRHTLNSK